LIVTGQSPGENLNENASSVKIETESSGTKRPSDDSEINTEESTMNGDKPLEKKAKIE